METDRQSVIIVGAGLCGSLLAARLRNRYRVTVVETSRRKHPLTNEIACDAGGVNTTINRARGMGGTTNYWHNALIELDGRDLAACGLDPDAMRPWYDQAWSLFLNSDTRRIADGALRDARQQLSGFSGTLAHMVVPQQRANMWTLANDRFPGTPVTVIEGTAQRLLAAESGSSTRLEVATANGTITLAADHVILAAGGLGTPVVLSRSFDRFDQVNGGYHDHPMAYTAKIQLRDESLLRRVSGSDQAGMSIRTGFVYEHQGVKAGIYLRPAIGLGLRSITGEARFILSDLRNDPFSPRKILQLLANPEALREGLLFKAGAGLRGSHFSLLLLGEQHPESDRGVTVLQRGKPHLNWGVSPRERAAYGAAVDAFLAEFAGDVVASNVIPHDRWEFRTAAHHSGGIAHYLDRERGGFAIRDFPSVYACDGSILKAGGIANSGLTLTALALQLAHQFDPVPQA